MVLLFVSCAMPAGAQPGSHDERSDKKSSDNMPASPIEPKKSLEEFRQGPLPVRESYSPEYKKFFLENQASLKRLEAIKKDNESLQGIDFSDPASIPAEVYIKIHQIEIHQREIDLKKEAIEKIYENKCDDESCKKLLQEINKHKKRIEELRQN